MNLQEAKKLEKQIEKILLKYLEKGSTIILALSGGPDSIFLLEQVSKLPIKIVAAHLDHQLRKESEKDLKFVQKVVEDSNNTFAGATSNIKEVSQKYGIGIEEAGRKTRYSFFEQLVEKHDAKFILTAHHADDNLETILLNLTRGATLQGLSGMRELSGKILRPLLQISKDQIISYLKLKQIPYLTDPSNASNIYTRNRIRNKIVPELTKINPNLAKTIATNSQILRETNQFLQEEAQRWISCNSLNEDHTELNAKEFRKTPPLLQKNIIRELYKNRTGDNRNIESIHIQEVLTIINQNIGNKRKKLGKLNIAIKNNVISVV